MCQKHYVRWKKYGDPFYSKIAERGDGHTDKKGYRIIFKDGRYQKEHRYVMETFLGRKLFRHENVHHINGDRSDNKIKNLELWNTSQPCGQRVSDKIQWAKDILQLYCPELLAMD